MGLKTIPYGGELTYINKTRGVAYQLLNNMFLLEHFDPALGDKQVILPCSKLLDDPTPKEL